jgi:predicted enzyme related to lactoylglutathione lyase
VHFEINADDAERAIHFYKQVFGWTIEKWAGPVDYWLISTGEDEPGINGAITSRSDPPEATVNTVDVPDLDKCVKLVQENGGTLLMPKMSVPGVGYMAYCKDTEGNTFGMRQSHPGAR